jgi:hypothetical protein
MYQEKKKTRDERTGSSFKTDPRFENLIAMTDERRETILQSSPTIRMSYGHYVAARSAAHRLATLDKEPTS